MFLPSLGTVSADIIGSEEIIELERNDKIDSSKLLKKHQTSITSETDSKIYKVWLGMNSTEN